MTREVKLGLIIGFTVTLVVAILLSDHLSQARADKLDAGVPEPRVVAPPLMRNTTPLDLALPRAETPEPVTPRNETLDERRGWDEPEEDADPIGDLRGAMDRAARSEPEEIQRPMVIDQGSTPPYRLSEVLRDFSVGRSGNRAGRSWEDELDEPVRDESRGRTGGERDSRAGERVPERETDRVDERVGGRWYIVQPNDSLFAIAAAHLGDGHRWGEIASANTDRVNKDGGVRVGVRLWIPGAAVEIERKSESTERRSATAKPAGATREYEVKPGDVLSRVAARELGSADRMREILELNGLEDPNHIRVGQKLKLPAR